MEALPIACAAQAGELLSAGERTSLKLKSCARQGALLTSVKTMAAKATGRLADMRDVIFLSFILILLRLFLLTANQNQALVHSDFEQTQGHEAGTIMILAIISGRNAAKGYFRTEIVTAGFYLCRTGARASINGEKSHNCRGKNPHLCTGYCLHIHRH
jgi:hypothetical protein